MFYFIKGELALLDPGFAVVDACGVGYKLTISGTTYSALPHITGTEAPKVKLYSHLSVREDSIELYGFATLEELNIFRLLISVSGVGPKAAMAILSQMSPEKLALAVCTKDKLKAEASAADNDNATEGTVAASDAGGRSAEALDALTVLGFNRAVALDALRGIDIENTELEDVIREALKKLMK